MSGPWTGIWHLLPIGLLAFVAAAATNPAGPLVSAAPARSAALAQSSAPVVLFVDSDDDNANGVADRLEPLSRGATEGIAWLAPAARPLRILRLQGSAARLIADGRRVGPPELDRPIAARRAGLEAVAPGQATVTLGEGRIEADVLEVLTVDARGRLVDPTTMHASISRTLPVGPEASSGQTDEDALRWIIVGPRRSVPQAVRIASRRADGQPLDELSKVKLSKITCPEGVSGGLTCRGTPIIRAASDSVDRGHPQWWNRSLLVHVGGRLLVFAGELEVSSIRVGGPRNTRIGPIGRYRATLRVRVVRVSPGGLVPIGGDEQGALDVAREEVRVAAGVWGQCGVSFGPERELDLEVVDPPLPHMLAVGCDLGLGASGGTVTFAVGSRTITVETRAGEPPSEVANAVAAEVVRAGYMASVSLNPRTEPAAFRTADVLVRSRAGQPVAIELAEGRPISTDSTLSVCVGDVDLTDGLDHFTDYDSMAGTVEERSLIKALSDDDPTTVDVVVVSSFSRSTRIGESFIVADGSPVASTVILDRAAVRVRARSFALAHELGHVLLNLPGHPDDYGVDASSSLMDSDATDSTVFGPRRLSKEECVQAVVESGPTSPLPLLRSWPLFVSSPRLP